MYAPSWLTPPRGDDDMRERSSGYGGSEPSDPVAQGDERERSDYQRPGEDQLETDSGPQEQSPSAANDGGPVGPAD